MTDDIQTMEVSGYLCTLTSTELVGIESFGNMYVSIDIVIVVTIKTVVAVVAVAAILVVVLVVIATGVAAIVAIAERLKLS